MIRAGSSSSQLARVDIGGQSHAGLPGARDDAGLAQHSFGDRYEPLERNAGTVVCDPLRDHLEADDFVRR